MSKGSQAQHQPANVIGNAVHVAKMATGEIAGPKTRQASTTRSQRSEIARKAATARWDGD